MQNFFLTIRFIFFAVFFLVGSSAIVLSILVDPELVNYYHNKAKLAEIQQQNEKIQSLTEQYDAQVKYIEAEPNVLERLSPLTFGTKPQAEGTTFPQVQNEALRTETEEILSRIEEPQQNNPTPPWLERIKTSRIRRSLFFSGAGLVIIAFIFFGTDKNAERF